MSFIVVVVVVVVVVIVAVVVTEMLQVLNVRAGETTDRLNLPAAFDFPNKNKLAMAFFRN